MLPLVRLLDRPACRGTGPPPTSLEMEQLTPLSYRDSQNRWTTPRQHGRGEQQESSQSECVSSAFTVVQNERAQALTMVDPPLAFAHFPPDALAAPARVHSTAGLNVLQLALDFASFAFLPLARPRSATKRLCANGEAGCSSRQALARGRDGRGIGRRIP